MRAQYKEAPISPGAMFKDSVDIIAALLINIYFSAFGSYMWCFEWFVVLLWVPVQSP